jgi:hypothetical protein
MGYLLWVQCDSHIIRVVYIFLRENKPLSPNLTYLPAPSSMLLHSDKSFTLYTTTLSKLDPSLFEGNGEVGGKEHTSYTAKVRLIDIVV